MLTAIVLTVPFILYGIAWYLQSLREDYPTKPSEILKDKPKVKPIEEIEPVRVNRKKKRKRRKSYRFN